MKIKVKLFKIIAAGFTCQLNIFKVTFHGK